jgi:hypothetical protein
MSYSREHGVGKPAPVTRKLRPSKVIAKSREEAAEKQQKAVDLRRAGASFQEIANALGYASPSGAKKAVEAAVRKFAFESTADMLQMDLSRLDEWAKLCTHKMRTTGDVSQVDRLMRIMDKRHYLLGVTPASLAEQKENGTMQTQGGMNVVIAATERDFVRGMMIAVGVDPDGPEAKAYEQARQGASAPTPQTGGKKEITAGKKLRKKKPGTPSATTPAEVPDDGGLVVLDAGGVQVDTLSAHDRERIAAQAISVKRKDEDEVVDGVPRIHQQRI